MLAHVRPNLLDTLLRFADGSRPAEEDPITEVLARSCFGGQPYARKSSLRESVEERPATISCSTTERGARSSR